jgi:hypothetical protein
MPSPGRRTNVKGRSVGTQFINLHRGITDSLAYQSLSCEARSLLIEIWRRHNGRNNGAIAYSFREARAALRVGKRKIERAFAELMDRGFLIRCYKGAFNVKEARASEWELTMEPRGDNKPKALYKDWCPPPDLFRKKNHGAHSGDRTGTTVGTTPPNSHPK